VKIFSRLLPSSVDPRSLAALGVAAWSVLLGSCSQTPITVNLHALQASGNATFICRGDDNPAAGHKIDECPDYVGTVATGTTRRLLSLVTQTATNEVAVIDLAGGAIVDDDLSTPGYSFLRVGARPGAIVSTPGGAASFVGVSGLNKNGIFALPSTCLESPAKGQAARDLTGWSACHLSSTPGDITMLLDTAKLGDKQRVACDPANPKAEVESELEPAAQLARECPADLIHEKGPAGRRKLLVALPEEHKVVLVDAQRLLDNPPGEFPACEVEAEFELKPKLPTGVAPTLPPDLQVPPGTDTSACQATLYPGRASDDATPAGFANAGDTVYVADRTLPVVHRLDVSDPCAVKQLEPLAPYSYLSPNRVVTTSRVAVSPLTPTGKQYVYAVDDTDQPSASVMAFDVSPGSSQSTPIIFGGSPRNPYLPPDRLRFSAPVRDVSFVMRDFPAPDLISGVGQFGLQCSPFAKDAPDSPAGSYRPNSDFSQGARPLNLRGVFGFAMLTNGQIVVIDVEDFDAPCRRPISSNPFAKQDFRGCSNDLPGLDANASYYTSDGQATGTPYVSNESSCNVIEPNRPRSAALSISSTTVGLSAPTLRAFPQFTNPDPSSVLTVDQQPHMLAVNFENPSPTDAIPIPAVVNVSSTLYTACPNGMDSDGCLQLNPNTDNVRNSLVLPLTEPRSYAQDEAPTLTFEGRVFPDRASGFFDDFAADGSAVLKDPDANFCAAGVEDSAAIATEAEALSIPATDKDWRDNHADYVQITGDFPAPEDSYWSVGHGSQCKALLPNSPSTGNRDACVDAFGTLDNPAVLKETRDLTITAAFADHLQVLPRNCSSGDDCANRIAQLACCFPTGTAYTVRASHQWLLTAAAGLHDMAAKGPGGQCVHTASCDPRKQFFHSRAFEVCAANGTDCVAGSPSVGCVVGAGDIPVQPNGAGSQCIFENLTARFVVYRGAQPSVRGMAFNWQTTGGFIPLVMSLATQSSAVNPQSMSYLSEGGYLAVVDGSTLGLTLFDLNSLGVLLPSPYF
jgi:hypothetical protein